MYPARNTTTLPGEVSSVAAIPGSFADGGPPSRRILVVNAKGGCGKTTIATNLASYYSRNGLRPALVDYDPQGSSMQWLSLRKGDASAGIHGVAAFSKVNGVTKSWQMRMPPDTNRIILDAPAGVQGQQLVDLAHGVDTILVPVLPSPIDIHAASRFIRDLLLVVRVRARSMRVGVVANRVRKNALVYRALQRFLESLDIPFVATLRDTQNYVHAATDGLGIHELGTSNTEQDRHQWRTLIKWLESAER